MKKTAFGLLVTAGIISQTSSANANPIPYEHLTWATSSDPIGTLPLKIRRSNPAAAYGIFDANRFTHKYHKQEARFFSLRTAADDGAEGTTYFFESPDTSNMVRKIVPTGNSLPDVYLSEITWGTDWHIESVSVILVNAAVINTSGVIERIPEYKVGVAFNSAALQSRNESHPMVVENRLKNLYSLNGYETVTAFKLPPEVLEADAIKLLDSTDAANRNASGKLINTARPRSSGQAYKPHHDGFDLDAIGVHTTPSENCASTMSYGILARNKNLCNGLPIPLHLRGEFDSNYSVKVRKGAFEANGFFYWTGDSCLYEGNFYPTLDNGGPGTYTFTAKKRDGNDFSFTGDLICE